MTERKSSTVRLSLEQTFEAEELAVLIGRRCGRIVSRNEIDLDLWRLARDNPMVQDALVQRLGAHPGR